MIRMGCLGVTNIQAHQSQETTSRLLWIAYFFLESYVFFNEIELFFLYDSCEVPIQFIYTLKFLHYKACLWIAALNKKGSRIFLYTHLMIPHMLPESQVQ
jgi:hypothetical protein